MLDEYNIFIILIINCFIFMGFPHLWFCELDYSILCRNIGYSFDYIKIKFKKIIRLIQITENSISIGLTLLMLVILLS
jgi:hypothetical protein